MTNGRGHDDGCECEACALASLDGDIAARQAIDTVDIDGAGEAWTHADWNGVPVAQEDPTHGL